MMNCGNSSRIIEMQNLPKCMMYFQSYYYPSVPHTVVPNLEISKCESFLFPINLLEPGACSECLRFFIKHGLTNCIKFRRCVHFWAYVLSKA